MTFFMPAPGIIAGGAAGGGGLLWPPVLTSSIHGSMAILSSNLTLPPTVTAGDLLIIHCYKDTAVNYSSAAIPGFTKVGVTNNIGNWRQGWTFAKIADGTEGGTTVTATGMSNSNSLKYSSYSLDTEGGGTFDPSGTAAQASTTAISVTRTLTAGDAAFIVGHRANNAVMEAANADTALLAEGTSTVRSFVGYKKTIDISGSTALGFASSFNAWAACVVERNAA